MAVIDFLNTFRIQADEPIDSRFVLADEAARFSYPTGALYEGLIVYQLDTKVLWTLVDKNASSEASGWSRETSDDIVSIVASDVKSNGFRDLVFTFESGKVITIENAFREAEKGDKGDTGADGARGEKGDTGSQGLMGEQGLPGIDGINGINGTNGTDGTDGTDGAQGARGEQGLPGTPGTDGTNGSDGAMGLPGINGTDGSDGAAGKDGAMGNTGPAGSDASVTKANVDAALEIGDASQDFYYNNDGEWVPIPAPLKGQIDDAIGANPGTNDTGRFYAEDGQFRTPAGGGGTGTAVVANPTGAATENLTKLEVADIIYGISGGSSGGDLWVDLTKGSGYSYLNATGNTVEGTDATDANGNTDAAYIQIFSQNDSNVYYRIENNSIIDTPESAIIRQDNINTGNIVVSKTY